MAKQYFPTVGKIAFEGTSSKNPMAFRYYEPERVVKGRKMKDWLRFSMAWWHTLCAEGADQFGGGTKQFAWNEANCFVPHRTRQGQDGRRIRVHAKDGHRILLLP